MYLFHKYHPLEGTNLSVGKIASKNLHKLPLSIAECTARKVVLIELWLIEVLESDKCVAGSQFNSWRFKRS